MQKISFGSFPLNDIRKDDRKCLDRYLIKTFSDNIAISDAMRNLASVKNLMYITPDTLMKKWLGGNASRNFHSDESDRTSSKDYDAALKRAFYILKEFYKKIQHAPFYKEYVYYPIYVEKIDKINIKGGSSKSSNNTSDKKGKKDFNSSDVDQNTIQMNYSFLILSNDLTKSLKIDEIKYDDNASLNFLFLFIEFFSGGKFNKSIHSFDEKDYQFLVRMYQFIEESNKSPIQMVLDLYKLLGLIKQASEGKDSKLLIGNSSNNLMSDIDAGNLRKYKGLIRHNIYDIVRKRNMGSDDPKAYQESFRDIMDLIFKSEGLSGLYAGVDTKAELGERYQYLYSSNKYREILNVANELVDYNKLKRDSIITQDRLDFDFRVERGEYTIDIKRDIIAQKYQTFFKQYVESISEYLKNTVQLVLESLDIPDEISKANINSSELLSNRGIEIQRELADAPQQLSQLMSEAQMASNNAAAFGADEKYRLQRDELYKKTTAERKYNDLETHIKNLEIELDQIKVMLKLNTDIARSLQGDIKSVGDKLYEDIKDRILTGLSTDLTFIFDAGKRFFTEPLVANGFMSTVDNPKYSPIKSDGFDTMANNAHNESMFPKEIEGAEGNEPNPEMYTAQVVKTLKDSFDIMAEDAITLLSDQIMPAIQKNLGLTSEEFNRISTGKNTSKEISTNIQYEILDRLMQKFQSSDGLPNDFKDTLANDIFKNRFINNVLYNFRKMFRVRKTDSVVQFDEQISQLHPLIKKLLQGDKEGNYFKSFIINFDTVEQLYNTKFILDTQKFLTGLENRPPRKLSNVSNRIQTVLFDFLGLKKNPVWLLSKTDVYLSMPDDLSLTNTGILSKIPKTELMDVCKIKSSDYWNEGNMNKVVQFKNKGAESSRKEYESALKKVEQITKDIEYAKAKDPKKADELRKKLTQANKRLDVVEEKYNKEKLKNKNYTPNAFVFAEDDPDKAANTELLSDAEREDLNRAKENMEKGLNTLDPYDSEEVDKMKDMISTQTQRSHPFDFEDREESPITPEEAARLANEAKDKEFEDFLKERDEAEERKN
jgi:hypothetical protein